MKNNFLTKICRKFRFLFLFLPLERILRYLIKRNPNSQYLTLLVPQSYRYKKNTFRDFYEDGIKMNLNINHYNDHLTYWFFKKDKLLNNIIRLIKEDDIVFDVGVNIGYYLLNFSKKANQGNVYGFEPNPKVFSYVNHNCDLNKTKNVFLTNAGLGNEKGSFKMAQINNNLGMNKIISEYNSEFKTFDVWVDTLDNFLENNKILTINIIKVDVEGFEFNVLKGAEKSLLDFKPILVIEIDEYNLNKNNTSFEELKEWLNIRYYLLYDANELGSLEKLIDKKHFDILGIPKEKIESYKHFLN